MMKVATVDNVSTTTRNCSRRSDNSHTHSLPRSGTAPCSEPGVGGLGVQGACFEARLLLARYSSLYMYIYTYIYV